MHFIYQIPLISISIIMSIYSFFDLTHKFGKLIVGSSEQEDSNTTYEVTVGNNEHMGVGLEFLGIGWVM